MKVLWRKKKKNHQEPESLKHTISCSIRKLLENLRKGALWLYIRQNISKRNRPSDSDVGAGETDF